MFLCLRAEGGGTGFRVLLAFLGNRSFLCCPRRPAMSSCSRTTLHSAGDSGIFSNLACFKVTGLLTKCFVMDLRPGLCEFTT